MQYCIAAEPNTGKTTLQCTTTDAEGRKNNTYTDALGRNIATESYVNGEAIRVVNTYDALSRVTEVLHPNGHMSTYKYDMLGNVVESQTPDAGTVKATYTPQGAIATRTTATGEVISYNYNFERLQSVSYSYHPNDSVVYTYGDSLSADLQKGRLLSVKYPMGSEKYTYGTMGEVVETVKSIVIDSTINKVHTYTTKAEYDSWNHLQSMTYPDGEVVNYQYYPSGQLQSIIGEKDGTRYPYLIETGYHVSGQTSYRKLGNQSEHRYFYDHKDRLQMTTLHINGQKISENSYSYDKVDNITTINGNNYYYQRYTYDELNRLVRATGYDFSVVAERPCSYDMTMQYNNMSSPVQFTQMIATETATTSVNNMYHYDASVQPNAPLQIGDTYYTYDAAGNPTSILNSEGKGKDLRWDAENRLRSISDSQEGLHHAYAYDHTGERILKRYGSAQQASYNGKDVGTLFDFGESYSAYVSPYFVETNNGYTKHYYAGATRLVSKIGEGVYQDSIYISYGEEEKDQYFYFQDHLGSSTYITTLTGEVAQYAAYTPYGELFREYRNVTPYKFNGKELDAETGLYYYGARYYNPGTALWLGVDPLASKYPSVSPYVYCVSNPVKYIDPDGREIIKSFCVDYGDPNSESQESKDNKVLITCADNFYDNDRSVSIWAHGNINGFTLANEREINSTVGFMTFLSERSDIYIENQVTQETTFVIMHSCSTGKEGGFAQRMSEVLNIVIVAPSENITVLKETAEEEGVKNGGTWNVFYRGKKVDSFEGTKKPIFEDPEQAIKTYIAKYKQLYENKE